MCIADGRIVLQPKEIGLPFTAYTAIDEVREVSSRGVSATACSSDMLA
jgi:hypothetical protein